jgi:hypothetical protein
MAERRATRGATLNDASHRFGRSEDDGDWLALRGTVDGAVPRLRPSVIIEAPRTIIACNRSPDIPLNRSINPYRCCDHAYTVV